MATTANIVSHVFRLHKYTAVFLVICSCLIVLEVTWSSSPIVCGSNQLLEEHFVNTWWRFGLWSKKGDSGPRMDHANLDFKTMTPLPGTYHYTFLFLLIQAFLFTVPYRLWVVWDKGALQTLLNKINDDSIEEEEERLAQAAKVFTKNMNRRKTYFWYYVSFQFLNLANVVGQMIFISMTFGTNFLTYGFHVLKNGVGSESPANPAFPMFAYCKVPDRGIHLDPNLPSANYGLCVLNVNVVNEKVYVVIWIWFLFLGVFTALDLMWRLTMASITKGCLAFFFGLSYRCSYLTCKSVSYTRMVDRCDVGDYFLLSRIAQNTMDEQTFRGLLVEINRVLEEQYVKHSLVYYQPGEQSGESGNTDDTVTDDTVDVTPSVGEKEEKEEHKREQNHATCEYVSPDKKSEKLEILEKQKAKEKAKAVKPIKANKRIVLEC